MQDLGDGMPTIPFGHGFNCGRVCGERFVRSAAVLVQQLLHICMATNNGILQYRRNTQSPPPTFHVCFPIFFQFIYLPPSRQSCCKVAIWD